MLDFLIAAIILVGLCVAAMCFNIICRGRKFPETEISRNKELRKMGITCAKEDEMKLWGKKNGKDIPGCADFSCEGCAGCDFYRRNENKKTEK